MTEYGGAAARIREMERRYDALCIALEEAPRSLRQDAELCRMLAELEDYYQSGLWLQDYQLDEQGGLPADLKRGVLSQDGVYDLLQAIKPWLHDV